MAKFKGDFYIVDLDEREIGGNLSTISRFDTWKEASKAWNNLPEPEMGCLWLARKNERYPSRDETITGKGPDISPLFVGFSEMIKDMAQSGEIKIKGKKSTRH
jgi:hypothetical protein